MNKRVLLVTKIGKNFGALLQAYALKKVLEKENCTVNIVNYALANTMRTYDLLPRVTGRTSLKRWIVSLKRVLQTKKSVKKFLEFREDFFSFTRVYYNFDELKTDAPEADLYITGSDQVWNPLISFDPAYYLLFGNKYAQRASYAASIGIDRIPNQYEKEFVERVNTIKYKSVRENSAQKLLESYGITSEVTLDPTLLLEKKDYDAIAEEPRISEPYVLLYLLIMPDDVETYLENLRKEFPKHIFVSIPGNTWAKKIGDVEMADIGPKEFVGLIKYADAILTTSFHGTVFSIVYRKKFMAVLPNATGGRISSILQELGLNKRIASKTSDVKNIKSEINYDNVEMVLGEKRRESYEYIKKIVSDKE